MAEAKIEEEACEECGAVVRENTLFCYNCGSSLEGSPVDDDLPPIEAPVEVPVEVSDNGKAALEQLAQKLDAEERDNAELLAQAAAERKKARVKPRKRREIVWEAVGSDRERLFVYITLLIVTISAAIVFLMVFWK